MKMTIKTFFYTLSAGFGTFCAYFNIEPVAMGILVAAIILDFLTGMTAAKVKSNYQSKKGRIMTIAKIFGISIVLLVSLILKVLGFSFEYFTMTMIMVLACHDIISSLRHVYFLRTGEDLGEFDATSMLIKKISDKLKKLVTKLLQDNE